jgi:F0F1-type ATP synthase assembly protein I
MKEPQSGDNQWRGFFITSAVGANVVCFLLVGYFIGHFLGKKLGSPIIWTTGGVLIGLGFGIVSVIFLLKKFTEDNNG